MQKVAKNAKNMSVYIHDARQEGSPVRKNAQKKVEKAGGKLHLSKKNLIFEN